MGRRRSAGFVFLFCFHSGTFRTADPPQISRIASTSSGEPFTRCCACSTATEPSCEHSSNRSEEHTSELQSQFHLVCRLLLEKKNKKNNQRNVIEVR